MKFYEEEYTAADKRDFYEPTPTPAEKCQNCGKPCEELVYLKDWDYNACPICARECELIDEAERLCPELYSQIIRANGVREIEAVFQTHGTSNCPHCRAALKTIQAAKTASQPAKSLGCEGEVA